MTTKRQVLFQTGDVDALTYGGGVVYRTKHSITWEFWDELIEDQEKYEVWQIDVPEDVIAEHDWVDWDSVASSVGADVEDLLEAGHSRDPKMRVRVLEDAVGHYGPHEFDQYPLSLTRSELKRRWRHLRG